MLIDGLKLIEGSFISNLVLSKGTSFPNNPDEGELFYRSDSSGIFIYNGQWTRIQEEISDLTALLEDLLDTQISVTSVPNTIPVRDTNSLIATHGLRITTNEVGFSPLNVLTWNDLDKTYDFSLINNVTGQLFQEQFFYGRAVGNIANGDVVMFAGSQGDQALFTKANTAAVGFEPRWVVGIATQDITNNEWGYITSFGKVRDLLVDFPAGTILYLNPAVPGGFTNIEPSAPNPKIVVAAVLRQSTSPNSHNAIILVRPDFGYHMYDLHDVQVNSPQNNQVLAWNGTSLRWENKSNPVGGSNTQIIFNDNGLSNGDTSLTWDKTNDILSIAGSISINATSTINASTANVSSTSATTIFSFPTANFRSGKIIVQVRDTITSEVQIAELLIVHNGTNAFISQIGNVFTGATTLATFSVTLAAGQVNLLSTRSTANATNYKITNFLVTV